MSLGFEEIRKGISEKAALKEAERCLQCQVPTCIDGCPAKVDCKGFIQKIKEKQPEKALEIIHNNNLFPAFTSRCCNTEQQCEGSCVLAKKGRPVRIALLERFASENAGKKETNGWAKNGTGAKRIAVIGSGPAGLAAALEARKNCFEAKVFDREYFFGGLLVTGIPSYRLPKVIVAEEIKRVEAAGVKFEAKALVGEKPLLEEILKEFDAIILAVGETVAKKIDGVLAEGEGIWNWTGFLKEFCSGEKKLNGGIKKVVVIGGGDTAMDCARVAKRLGKEVTIAYRKVEEVMPCQKRELAATKQEGIIFQWLLAPVEFKRDENGKLKAVRFQKNKTQKEEFVSTGEFVEIETDAAIIAIGQELDEIVFKGTQLQKSHLQPNAVKTDLPNVFIAGDAINKNKTVVHSIESAKRAVKEMTEYFKKQETAKSIKPGHATSGSEPFVLGV